MARRCRHCRPGSPLAAKPGTHPATIHRLATGRLLGGSAGRSPLLGAVCGRGTRAIAVHADRAAHGTTIALRHCGPACLHTAVSCRSLGGVRGSQGDCPCRHVSRGRMKMACADPSILGIICTPPNQGSGRPRTRV